MSDWLVMDARVALKLVLDEARATHTLLCFQGRSRDIGRVLELLEKCGA